MKTFRCLLCIVAFIIAGSNAYGQQKYQKPALSDPNSWSAILFPDIQSYVKFGRNQPILDLMTAWVQENQQELNIRSAFFVGDLVEQNDIVDAAPARHNQHAKQQWEASARSLSKLDGRIPYFLCTGNHDYSYFDGKKGRSQFKEHFPVDKNYKTRELLKHVTANSDGIPTLENAAYEFVSPHGVDFLVLSLEFAPRDTVVAWAKKIVSLPKYRNHTVILLTHAYLNAKNERIVKANYPIEDGNYGEALWEKLVKPSSNIRLVLCGHVAAPDDWRGHVGFSTDMNSAGKKVHQMMFNAQALGGGWHGNGGDGWLRIFEFMPDRKTVKVRTFSPFFAISPTTQQYAWQTESFNEITFSFE
ncbi:MAG: metallophosphoesterase [Bacteroidales bacterium]|jgi:hypothetical protein|nr:metallophosphoesterase [Bacteroidales bacterium]